MNIASLRVVIFLILVASVLLVANLAIVSPILMSPTAIVNESAFAFFGVIWIVMGVVFAMFLTVVLCIRPISKRLCFVLGAAVLISGLAVLLNVYAWLQALAQGFA